MSGFVWSHIGWLTYMKNFPTAYKAIPDLSKFPELIFLNRFDQTVPLVYGIVMLAISAGLAWYLADEEWVKLRGTITGLIGASFFIIDGLRGGHYVGRGLARYMPYSDIDPGRMAFAMGLVGLVMAALNYVVAKIASTDVWLFYKTFVDFFIVAALAMVAIRFARKAA